MVGHSMFCDLFSFLVSIGQNAPPPNRRCLGTSLLPERKASQNGAGGARLPLRTHLYICMFLHKGRYWFSNSFVEGQNVVYWSHNSTTLSWGLGLALQIGLLVLRGGFRYSFLSAANALLSAAQNSCPGKNLVQAKILSPRIIQSFPSGLPPENFSSCLQRRKMHLH